MSYAQVASVQPSQATMIANPQQILNPTIPSNTSFSLFNWKNTSSSLKNRPFMGCSTPLSSSPNSLFLDTRSHKVPDQFIIDKFKNELIGVAFNPNMSFLELARINNVLATWSLQAKNYLKNIWMNLLNITQNLSINIV